MKKVFLTLLLMVFASSNALNTSVLEEDPAWERCLNFANMMSGTDDTNDDDWQYYHEMCANAQ